MRSEKEVQQKFNKGCVKYELLCDADKILVAVSGGKDSLMLCKLLAERARIYSPKIEVEAAHVVMENIPYETDHTWLKSYCDDLGIKLHILHSRFDESTDPRKTHCFLCAWNRRKTLFNFAQECGFNKVALGHHQDDILVTWLMNITFEGNCGTMLPKMKMNHYPLEVIRPMCLVEEKYISEFAGTLGFAEQKTKCSYETTTNRTEMKKILRTLEELNPEARYSMWLAMEKASLK